MRRSIRIAGIVLCVVLIVSGALMASIDLIKSAIRQGVIDEQLSNARVKILSGTDSEICCAVPATDILAITGEEVNEEENLNEEYEHGEQILHLAAILEIPSIEVEEPVWVECSRTAMRYGVVLWKTSVMPGDIGNCIIIGHRNRHISTIFCNLSKIKCGAQALLKLKNGRTLIYEVKSTDNCSPEATTDYLNDTEDSRLTLITCATEYGSGWRFVVVCYPISED